jgi:modification methylase
VTPVDAVAFMTAPARRTEPRVAFLSVVEAGLIAAGETLRDEKARHSAIVRADGTLALGQMVGSIHKVGALAQGLPACNGWIFWHASRRGRLVPIDTMRSDYRAAYPAG